MDFLLLPLGSAGDVNPFLGLAAELKRRGHNVVLGTHGYFTPKAQALGIEVREIGTRDDYLRALENPDLFHPTRGSRAVLGGEFMEQAVRRQYEVIAELQKQSPKLVVVAGTLAFGARIAQEKLGVPTAVLHLQPAVIRSLIEPPVLPGMQLAEILPTWVTRGLLWLADRMVIDQLLKKSVTQFRRELGLPRVRRYFDEWLHGATLTIAMFPAWYASPGDWPVSLRLAGFPRYDGEAAVLAADVEEFLEAGPPPVVCTFGTGMRHGAAQFAAVAKGLEQQGERGILLTPFREQWPVSLPATIRCFDYVPLASLLPRCAAIIHHGGIGTTSQALAAGIPQIICPLAHDQPDNGRRIERLGCGVVLPQQQITAERVAAVVQQLLSDGESFKNKAAAIVPRFENDPTWDDVCRWLEHLEPVAATRVQAG